MTKYFNATCTDIDLYQCDDTETFIDPCDCMGYYRCVSYNMLYTVCNEGTLFDPDLNGCNHYDEVKKNSCHGKSWERCNVTESRQSYLSALCTNTTFTTTPLATRPTEPPEDTPVSPGLIIGLILAGAALAILILIIIVVIRKRKQALLLKKSKAPQVLNPEYFEDGSINNPYATIEDSRMQDPTYQGQTSTLGIVSMTTSTLPQGEDPSNVYDNSVSRVSDKVYTSTLPTGDTTHEPGYATLAPGGRPVLPKSRDSKGVPNNALPVTDLDGIVINETENNNNHTKTFRDTAVEGIDRRTVDEEVARQFPATGFEIVTTNGDPGAMDGTSDYLTLGRTAN